jgi:gluconolactonase
LSQLGLQELFAKTIIRFFARASVEFVPQRSSTSLFVIHSLASPPIAHMTPEIPIEAFEIFATGLDHPECLAFDRYGDLWAGGEKGQIYRISSERKVTTLTNLGGFCAGLAFSPKDELFVCNPGQGIIRVEGSGEFSVFASSVGAQKIICPNYGLFDAVGNYYVTDSGNWKKNNGYLLRFAPDGNGEILAGPLGYANGLALSADEKSLFMVESNTDRVLRFEIRADGCVSAPEVYAEDCGRFPDGLTLDAECNLYVCCYASDEIWRISPSREKSLFAWDRWAILLGSPTNMAFGGENFDELYVANLARTTITRCKIPRRGQPLANQKAKGKLKPRPTAL